MSEDHAEERREYECGPVQHWVVDYYYRTDHGYSPHPSSLLRIYRADKRTVEAVVEIGNRQGRGEYRLRPAEPEDLKTTGVIDLPPDGKDWVLFTGFNGSYHHTLHRKTSLEGILNLAREEAHPPGWVRFRAALPLEIYAEEKVAKAGEGVDWLEDRPRFAYVVAFALALAAYFLPDKRWRDVATAGLISACVYIVRKLIRIEALREGYLAGYESGIHTMVDRALYPYQTEDSQVEEQHPGWPPEVIAETLRLMGRSPEFIAERLREMELSALSEEERRKEERRCVKEKLAEEWRREDERRNAEWLRRKEAKEAQRRDKL